MLLLYIIIELAVASLADPFHKYPYVFLLDVGNEEIEKTNTEQIRLTIPGGSLALKYPATGDGDTIGHVRVSGIDFGTDLKANIVQGGPGYKYVVLVFMGNPGVSYDAVVTIQTVPNVDDSDQIVSNINSGDTNKDFEDDGPNDSAEDTSDTETIHISSVNKNAQKMQSSSNIYEYVSNEVVDTQNSDGDNDDDEIQNPLDDETQNSLDDESEDMEDGVQDSIDDNSSDDTNENVGSKNYYSEEESPNGDHVYSLNDNGYGKYQAFRPLIIGGVRFYPQAAVYMQGGYNKPTYDQENHNNDDGDDDNESNYKDTNNNQDADYGSPVEY